MAKHSPTVQLRGPMGQLEVQVQGKLEVVVGFEEKLEEQRTESHEIIYQDSHVRLECAVGHKLIHHVAGMVHPAHDITARIAEYLMKVAVRLCSGKPVEELYDGKYEILLLDESQSLFLWSNLVAVVMSRHVVQGTNPPV